MSTVSNVNDKDYFVVYFKSGLHKNIVHVKRNVKDPKSFIDNEVKPYGLQYIIAEEKSKSSDDTTSYKLKGKGFINIFSLTAFIQSLIIVILVIILYRYKHM